MKIGYTRQYKVNFYLKTKTVNTYSPVTRFNWKKCVNY